MNKKGFTLVELLAILAVLGIMVLLVVPQLGGSMDSKEEKELEKIIDIIESAGKTYHSFEDKYKIPVSTLVEEDYLTIDLTDPTTGEELDGCVRVIKDSEGIYDYKYTSCDSIDVPLIVELNGGTSTQTFETTYYDSTIIELVDPTKTNSNFLGWEIVKGNSVLQGKTLIIGDRETIIHAKWQTIPKLEVELNGGTSSQTFGAVYESGSTITLETPTKTGYTFAGWQVTTGNSVVSGSNFTMGSEDTVLEATWSVNTYTYNIEYKSSSGVQLGTSTATYNYETTNTISPKSFTGYTSPSSQSISWDSTTAKTITFTYTPITYTISYTLNSGTVATANKTSYTIETVTFTLNNPSRTGYTFKGWTGSNGTTASTSVSITKGSTGNKSYTANWEANTYTITYNANGGSGAPTSQTKTHGVTLTLSTTKPTKTGYAFLGWGTSSTATSATYQPGDSYTSNASATLYAVWINSSPVSAYSCANAKSGTNYMFTYTGNCTMINDGSGNWRVKFLTSGDLTPTVDLKIDAFLVGGGGGGGGASGYGGSGGGGGYVTTKKGISLSANTKYSIVVGAGGTAGAVDTSGGTGGSTTAFGSSAAGGGGGKYGSSAPVGGVGITTGGTGTNWRHAEPGGTGSGTTTREFGVSNGTLYAGGGGGGAASSEYEEGEKADGKPAPGGAIGGGFGAKPAQVGTNGTANTGSGGGGGGGASAWASSTERAGGAGGSGIVVIRNNGWNSTSAYKGITYLYNNGNQNTSLTGGWSSYVESSTSSVTFDSTSITINAKTNDEGDSRYAAIYTNNKIDVTNYSVMIVKFSQSRNYDHSEGLRIALTTSNTHYHIYDSYCVKYLDNATGGTIALDVSDITGSYYVGIHGNVIKANITEISLE